ncbi:hypothetical protein V3O24_05900 [Methylobacter sp. Wu8]|uniref:hypothetical protein n=1 Tax=Methylobacter sp. Wu8 TaxID=3118457 RepID=UPI002F2CC3DE
MLGNNKWMLWLAALGIGITLWMFWRHVYAYDGNIKTGFSKNSADWANFGSYVGGVLSPFFSLLAFAGLLWTINIQTQQIKHLQEESKRSEVYRIIEKLVARIDHNYKKAPLIQGLKLFDFANNWTPDNAASIKHLDELIATYQKDIYSDTTNIIIRIEIDLDQLLYHINLYETPIGKKHLLRFYQWEYLVTPEKPSIQLKYLINIYF